MRPNSKYQALRDHLQGCARDRITLSFYDIEKLLGSALPASARTSLWWSNRRRGGLQAAGWLEAGYVVAGIDLDRERVTFSKV